MTYAQVTNDVVVEYPVYEGDIVARYPNVSFPSPFVPPIGYVNVIPVSQPTVNYTQNLDEGIPVRNGSEWSQNWIVSSATAEEIAQRTDAQWQSVRDQRDSKLQACDWTQLPDVPLTEEQKAEWVTYRQQLRDVTNQPDPFNIVWPVAPQA